MRRSFSAFLGAMLANSMAPALPTPSVGDLKGGRKVRTRHHRKSRTRQQVYHETSRFVRKSAKFGAQYHPGKLFKGHRI